MNTRTTTLLLASALLGGTLLWAGPAPADEASPAPEVSAPAASGDATAGKTIYAKCTACHGATANKNFKLKDPTDEQWTKVVKEGKKPMMPAFAALKEGDVSNVIAYIRSLQKK